MSKAQLKTTEYYLGLRYPIELRELSEEDGGGWMATIPQLGSHTFVGDGDTPEEAYQSLEALRKHLIPHLVANGEALPEPRDEEEDLQQYSGKLLIRVPRSLHAGLAVAAGRNDCSINQLVTQWLAQGLEKDTAVAELRHEIRHELQRLTDGLRFAGPTQTTKRSNSASFSIVEEPPRRKSAVAATRCSYALAS